MRFSGNGCQPCRNSRKKCDGRRPTCERCARSGKDCHGYREAFSIVNAENAYASGQRKRPRGPRAKAELVADRISPNPSRDVQSEAIAHYMRYHLAPMSGYFALEGNIREAVLSIWRSDPALEFAVYSVSTSIFSKIKRQPLAAAQASISYQRSVCALRAALPSVRKTNVDTCLLTTWFLARYEDSIYSPTVDNQLPCLPILRSQLHLVGATSCLRFWFDCPGALRVSSYVVTYTRRSLRKVALLGQFDLSDWLQDGALFGEQGFELELDRILMRLIRVRKRIFCLQEHGNTSPLLLHQTLHNLDTLHGEVLAIDKALIGWMDSFPGSLYYTKHELARHRAWSTDSFYHPCIYAYQDYNKAAISIQCYSYRMLANHLLIQSLELTEKYSGYTFASKPPECRHIVNCLANDMASSIPFCLGRFMVSDSPGQYGDNIQITNDQETEPYVAELIAAPLLIASTMKHMDIAYKPWFRSQLANIGRLTGYGLIEFVGTTSWFKL